MPFVFFCSKIGYLTVLKPTLDPASVLNPPTLQVLMDEQFLRTELLFYTKPLASSVLELHETELVVLCLLSGSTSIILNMADSLWEEISLNSLLQHRIKKATT